MIVRLLLQCYCFVSSSTFLNHFAFKLRKAQHDMKYQASGRGVVNQSHVEHVDGDASIKEILHSLKFSCCGPRNTSRLCNDKLISGFQQT